MARRKKILIICGAIVVVVAANILLLLHIYLSPANIAEKIKQLARRQLGCEVEIASAEASLLGLLELNDVRLSPPEGLPGGHILAVKHILLDCSPLRLLSEKGSINEIEITAPRVRIGDRLIALLKKLPPGVDDARHRRIPKRVTVSSGTIDLDAGLLYAASPSLTVNDLQLTVQPTSYSASRLSFHGGATEAHAGAVTITGQADLRARTVSLSINVPDVRMTEGLRAILPQQAVQVWDDLGLAGQGSFALKIEWGWGDEKFFRQTIVANPENCSLRIKDFPLRLTRVSGMLESDGAALRVNHAVGRYRDGTLELARGFVDKSVSEFEVLGRDLPLDAETRKALPPQVRSVVRDFNLSGGRVRGVYSFTLHKGEEKFPEHRLDLQVSDVSARFRGFPYLIGRIGGRIRWQTPRRSEKTHSRVDVDLKGVVGEGTVEVDARIPVPPIVRRQEGAVEYVNAGTGPDVMVRARRIQLDEALRAALPDEAAAIFDTLNLRGNVDVTALLKLMHDGNRIIVTSQIVIVELNGVQAALADFPYPVTNLVGRVEWDGQTVNLTELRGLCGDARVTIIGQFSAGKRGAEGVVKTSDAPQRTISVSVEGLQLDSRLRDVLGEGVQGIWEDLVPSGRINVLMSLRPNSDGGSVSVERIILDLDHCKVIHATFPYPVESITGKVIVKDRVVTFENVKGRVPGRETEVSISGKLNLDPGGTRTHTLFLEADRLRLDEALRDALGEQGKAIWADLQPTGRMNASCVLEFEPDRPRATLRSITLDLDRCGATYTGLPYSVQGITGTVTVKGSLVVMENLTGHVPERGTEVSIAGTFSLDPNDTDTHTLFLEANRLRLDEALRDALGEQGGAIWADFQPAGRVNASCVLELEPGRPKGRLRTLTLDLDRCKATYKGFPYTLEGLTGTVTADADAITLENVVGRAGIGEVSVSGRFVRADAQPAAATSRLNIRAGNIPFDHSLKQALPEAWASTWDKLQPGGRFSSDLDLALPAGGPARIAEGSDVIVRGFSLKGFPLPDAKFSLMMDEKSVHITDFVGTYYGGQVKGTVRLGRKDGNWTTHVETYNLDIKQINDERKFMKKAVRGQLTATVDLEGQGGQPGTLEGRVTAAIRNGELANIPVIANIVMKLLNVSWPTGETATITGADISCSIGRRRIEFDRVVLTSTSVPIGGKGRIRFDGTLDMDFFTSKDKKSLFRLIPIIGKPFEEYVWSNLRNLIIQVKVTGRVDDPHVKIVTLSPITKPLGALFGLIFGTSDDEKDNNPSSGNE